MRSRYFTLLLWIPLFSGCNIFGPLDTPSGDAQILAAARACFDQQDYSCATRYYSQLSSSSDQAVAEDILATLADNGATAGVFINAVLESSSNGGKLITKLAGSLTAYSGQTSRISLFHAFQKYSHISNNHLKNLMRFLASLSLISEILAETSTHSGIYQSTDLVLDPTHCNDTDIATYPTACNAALNSKLVTGSAIPSLDKATDLDLYGSPSLFMLNGGILQMEDAITQLGAGSKISDSTSSFVSTMSADATTTLLNSDVPKYRMALIKLGIGSN
jgi:hypothetical protein